MKTVSGLTEQWFKPIYDNDDGAEFKLRPLSQLTKIDVKAAVNPRTGRVMAEGYRTAFYAGVVDWKGVVDGKTGEPLEFRAHAERIFDLPEAVQHELLAKLLEISELSEDDTKNS